MAFSWILITLGRLVLLLAVLDSNVSGLFIRFQRLLMCLRGMFHRLFRVLLAGLMLFLAMMGRCSPVCVCSLLVWFCRSLVRVMSHSVSSKLLSNAVNPVYAPGLYPFGVGAYKYDAVRNAAG
jgi:hypothetical protein